MKCNPYKEFFMVKQIGTLFVLAVSAGMILAGCAGATSLDESGDSKTIVESSDEETSESDTEVSESTSGTDTNKRYCIVYRTQYGTAPEPVEKKRAFNIKKEMLPALGVTGMAFDGWTLTQADGTKIEPSVDTKVEGAVELTAKWRKPEIGDIATDTGCLLTQSYFKTFKMLNKSCSGAAIIVHVEETGNGTKSLGFGVMSVKGCSAQKTAARSSRRNWNHSESADYKTLAPQEEVYWLYGGTTIYKPLTRYACNTDNEYQISVREFIEHPVYGDGEKNTAAIPQNVLADTESAYSYAKHYGQNNNYTGTCADGWFIPSIPELSHFYETLERTKEAYSETGGTDGYTTFLTPTETKKAPLIWTSNTIKYDGNSHYYPVVITSGRTCPESMVTPTPAKPSDIITRLIQLMNDKEYEENMKCYRCKISETDYMYIAAAPVSDYATDLNMTPATIVMKWF